MNKVFNFLGNLYLAVLAGCVALFFVGIFIAALALAKPTADALVNMKVPVKVTIQIEKTK